MASEGAPSAGASLRADHAASAPCTLRQQARLSRHATRA